ncbi:hypothetical protein ACFQZC_06300 [Streptacidiphilus monticola]
MTSPVPSPLSPIERLRLSVERTRVATADREPTGIGHDDADDEQGTFATDGALGFDPFPLLRALSRHGVRAAAIGQVAGILHGSQELTGDLDLLWSGDPAEAPALLAALREVDARLTDDDGKPLPLDLPSLERPKVQFNTACAGGDLCTPALPWGGLDVSAFLDRAAAARDGDLTVRYLDRADLVAMRLAVGRPKDLRRAAELTALP